MKALIAPNGLISVFFVRCRFPLFRLRGQISAKKVIATASAVFFSTKHKGQDFRLIKSQVAVSDCGDEDALKSQVFAKNKQVQLDSKKSWRINQGNAILAVYTLPFELEEIRYHRLVKKEGVVCACLYQKIDESYWKKLSKQDHACQVLFLWSISVKVLPFRVM